MKVRPFLAVPLLAAVLCLTLPRVSALAEEQPQPSPNIACAVANTRGGCAQQTITCMKWEDYRPSCPASEAPEKSDVLKEGTRSPSLRRSATSREAAAATTATATTQALDGDAKPKPNRCKKCLEWSGLECVKKNDKGECVQWKERCLQWETYPC